MLSEKAKGKQRAVAMRPEPEPRSEPPTKDLIIRFTEGIPDLTVHVAENDVVRDVKKKIRELRPQIQDRRLRLILSGQLLADNVPLYTRVLPLEQRQRRAGTAEAEIEMPRDGATATIWLHCSVGPPMTEGEEEETRVQTAQLKPLRGFDRLAAAGFSEQDIANIRLQFHAHSAVDYIDQEFDTDEDFDEHARALEEQWIDSFDNGGGGSFSQSQGTSVLLNGVVLGFFFPLIPLFFFHAAKPAVFWEDGSEHEAMGNVIFSRQMQIGIVFGFLLNMIFGVWTYLLTVP